MAKKKVVKKKVAGKKVATKKPAAKKSVAKKSANRTLRWCPKKRKDEVQFQATFPKQATHAEIVGGLEEFWKRAWQPAVEVETGSNTILLVCELCPEIGRIAGYRALRGTRNLTPINVSFVVDHPEVAKRYDKLIDLHGDGKEFEKLYDQLTGEMLSWLKSSALAVRKVDPSFAKRASVFWIDTPEEITPSNVSWLFGKKLSKKELATPEVETAFPACIEAIFRSLRMRAKAREENFSGTNLYLASTATSDATLSLLTEMPEIGHLSLSFTSVTDQGMKYVTRLPNLETLCLGRTRVTDKGLKQLAKLPKLDDVSLFGLSLSVKGLRHLESLKSLWNLDLGNTGLSDQDLKPLLKLKKLKFLNLEGTRITDQGVQDLAKIKSLESLDLSGTKITDGCIRYLVQLPKLDTLYARGAKITAAGLARLEERISDCYG